jgi:hypothetical protein
MDSIILKTANANHPSVNGFEFSLTLDIKYFISLETADSCSTCKSEKADPFIMKRLLPLQI